MLRQVSRKRGTRRFVGTFMVPGFHSFTCCNAYIVHVQAPLVRQMPMSVGLVLGILYFPHALIHSPLVVCPRAGYTVSDLRSPLSGALGPIWFTDIHPNTLLPMV